MEASSIITQVSRDDEHLRSFVPDRAGGNGNDHNILYLPFFFFYRLRDHRNYTAFVRLWLRAVLSFFNFFMLAVFIHEPW